MKTKLLIISFCLLVIWIKPQELMLAKLIKGVTISSGQIAE